MNKPDSDVADPWAQHERSQALYFSSLSLQEKMEAVEAMADLVRHFQKMRAERAFRPAAASEKRKG
ncbi:MAG TPA: hypothetical protein VFG71_01230 [Nitrospiraceae bacterium]|nr:hypothetical protein [Nitrospiraceae bacterium]